MVKSQGLPSKTLAAGRRPYWTAEEDAQLVRLVKKYGTKNWGIIAKELQSPIPRKGKSCRSRWMHQLNPCIKHEPFSVDEERVLISKQREFGNKWSKIAAFLPGRTDNAIKNHWHGHVKRRLSARGFSSDEEDVMMEMKSEEPWNEMVELFPVPLMRSRLNCHAASLTAQQDMECARILLQLSQTTKPSPRTHHLPQGKTFPCITGSDVEETQGERIRMVEMLAPSGVKKEIVSEEEEESSESSKEPNNAYRHSPLVSTSSTVGGLPMRDEENNNSAEMIQPEQQKILSETLESAGLGHYSVLPLCPIKEEDINSEQHVVIVLQSSEVNCQDVPMQDSCSEGASICVLPEERSVQEWIREHQSLLQSLPPHSSAYLESFPVSEYAIYDPPFSGIREMVNENVSAAHTTSPSRDAKKPMSLLEISPKFDSSSSHSHMH